MVEEIGRELGRHEFVHHVNGIHSDNRLENLLVCSPSQHVRIHQLMKKGISRADSIQAVFDKKTSSLKSLPSPTIKTAGILKRSNAFMNHCSGNGSK